MPPRAPTPRPPRPLLRSFHPTRAAPAALAQAYALLLPDPRLPLPAPPPPRPAAPAPPARHATGA